MDAAAIVFAQAQMTAHDAMNLHACLLCEFFEAG